MSFEDTSQYRPCCETWNIPVAARSAVPEAMVKIITDRNEEGQPLHEPRVRIAAAQALVAMQRQNASPSGESRDYAARLRPRQQRARLVALAQRLGLGTLACNLGSNDSDGNVKRIGRSDDADGAADSR